MATVIVNNPVGSNVIARNQYTSVWVKRYWASRWRYVPFLFPEQSLESAAPTDSTAELQWHYGKYLELWGAGGGTLLPMNLENWHVRIVVHTVYGNFISWVGVVVGETMVEQGIDVATGYPRGDQRILCRGLEYLLERRVVLGTYVGEASRIVYLPKTRTFNARNSRRETLAGNRSAAVNPISGTFTFSGDGNKWSNYDIIKYLLAAFQPWYPYAATDGTVAYAPQFYLAGQTSALRYIFEEHRLGGRTLREALNSLIDRKRGLGWHIRTDGAGAIYIMVFSLSQFPVVGNNAVLPANPRQIDVPLLDDFWVEATFNVVSTSQVDQIVVEAEHPVKTVATVRFSNGTLEPAWDPDLDYEFALSELETSYKALADHLLANWDSVWRMTYYPNLQFSDFYSYAGQTPGPFAFLLSGGGSPYEALLAGFNVLDADGDNTISKEDLGLFTPNDTYQLVSEEARATDVYASVFSHFRVPKTWNWDGWTPMVDWRGQVDISTPGAFWNHDVAFERFLPFMEPGSVMGAEREYMEPFAVVEKPQRVRDILLALANDGAGLYNLAGAQAVVPDLTDAEFDELANEVASITWTEIQAGLMAYPPQYIQLDRAQQLGYPSCSLRMGDTGMRLIVKSESNHVFALNHTPVGTYEREPQFDYETLAATVFFDTDMMPRVVLPVWTNVTRDSDGSVTYQASPIGKQIYISVPQKHVWIAAPYTVVGLDGTGLVFYRDGAPGVIRDDTPDLRFIAQLAWVWYGQQRASLDLRIKNQLPWFRPGDLVRSTISGAFVNRVGTCVTAIARNYQLGEQEVSTGYGELDPSTFGMDGL